MINGSPSKKFSNTDIDLLLVFLYIQLLVGIFDIAHLGFDIFKDDLMTY